MEEEVKIVEPEKRPDEDELRQELARIRDAAENTKKNNTVKIIGIIIVAILAVVLLTFGMMAVRDSFGNGKKNQASMTDEDKTTITNGETINLDEYSEGVSITAGGEYNLTGRINAPVVVDSLEDVVLRLNGATIETSGTPAIASVGEGAITIEIMDGTENNLSDGGDSEYDGCIFAYGPMTITGNGRLNVYGEQNDGEGIATKSAPITIEGGEIYIESADDGINTGGNGGAIAINGGTVTIKAGGDGIDSNKNIVINGGVLYAMGSSRGGDAGIDAEDGYVINGGTVVALGSDMLETPKTSSKQNTLALNLSSNITANTLVTLTNNNGDVVVSFVTKESFRTLIISTPKLENGTYKLYTGGSNSGKLVNNFYNDGKFSGGTAVTVGNTAVFTVNSVVTMVGNNGRPMSR